MIEAGLTTRSRGLATVGWDSSFSGIASYYRDGVTSEAGRDRSRYHLGMAGKTRDVSVVVCTRNRSTFLAKALNEVVGRGYRGGDWELLVIDNGSTDDTLEIARSVETRHPQLVRVMVEEEVGLSAARNRGIADAKYPILAFIDDDAFPLEGWLEALSEAFDDPTVVCAGGPVAPMFEGELPPWFCGRYLPYLTVWNLGDEMVDLHYNEYPRGANMAFRADALARWGGFSPDLGRKGSSLLSCEETELCLRMERGGGRIVYVPGARVRHLTVAGRVTPKWMTRRFEAQGASEAIINWQHGFLRGLGIGLRAYWGNWRAARRERRYDGPLFARCQRRALVGYLKGIPLAIAKTPLYRPRVPTEVPEPWRPFG